MVVQKRACFPLSLLGSLQRDSAKLRNLKRVWYPPYPKCENWSSQPGLNYIMVYPVGSILELISIGFFMWSPVPGPKWPKNARPFQNYRVMDRIGVPGNAKTIFHRLVCTKKVLIISWVVQVRPVRSHTSNYGFCISWLRILMHYFKLRWRAVFELVQAFIEL